MRPDPPLPLMAAALPPEPPDLPPLVVAAVPLDPPVPVPGVGETTPQVSVPRARPVRLVTPQSSPVAPTAPLFLPSLLPGFVLVPVVLSVLVPVSVTIPVPVSPFCFCSCARLCVRSGALFFSRFCSLFCACNPRPSSRHFFCPQSGSVPASLPVSSVAPVSVSAVLVPAPHVLFLTQRGKCSGSSEEFSIDERIGNLAASMRYRNTDCRTMPGKRSKRKKGRKMRNRSSPGLARKPPILLGTLYPGSDSAGSYYPYWDYREDYGDYEQSEECHDISLWSDSEVDRLEDPVMEVEEALQEDSPSVMDTWLADSESDETQGSAQGTTH
ncbi:hypothetical protein P4O66_001873 [Electrophorus voltai]|uniref:Uncharacterized protein n=1 Tax=Electrophorus voltai TaxID=2609070 RepID=A0AAD8Z667_9TELE|nr:hypothetical protein P4O66_001873 [Electrophorus voltai]